MRTAQPENSVANSGTSSGDIIPEARSGPPPANGRDVATLYAALSDRPERHGVMLFVIAIIVTILLNMVGQVRLNQWNGSFFDAIGRKDVSAFLYQLLIFLALFAYLLTCVVAQTWIRERLKIAIRDLVSRHMMDQWLKPKRAYRLGFSGAQGSTPDQRIQEDTRLLAELSAELGAGAVHSALLIVSFIGILWNLSEGILLPLGSEGMTIPGYMVWCALLYAGTGSLLTFLVGRPLIDLNAERYQREADYRFALVRLNESAEAVSLYSGEADERRLLDREFDRVMEVMKAISFSLARLTWITSGYGWIALVFPVLVAAPGYFTGTLTLGGLMMVIDAFTQVQAGLRWFVDQFPRIAEWRAALRRIAAFHTAMLALDELRPGEERIAILPHATGGLAFKNLDVHHADGSVIIAEAEVEVKPGDRVLIVGASGSGKSTLFRAIGGLWPWGRGRIEVPPPGTILFLPQRPYLPLGSLKAAATYPRPPEEFTDEAVAAALARCGLPELTDRLDVRARWDKTLSIGQQQRLGFARVLLQKPAWVFLDEATSALDETAQDLAMSLFTQELAASTLVSIGHRQGLELYHNRSLKVVDRPAHAYPGPAGDTAPERPSLLVEHRSHRAPRDRTDYDKGHHA